ncbi:MAG: hypothetical protein KA354_16025 [Phycisphaerae bacterium]|nr:hypothetical protein [Phycisphaerae bacterium]
MRVYVGSGFPWNFTLQWTDRLVGDWMVTRTTPVVFCSDALTPAFWSPGETVAATGFQACPPSVIPAIRSSSWSVHQKLEDMKAGA